ncbi:polysaccharide biosynthesis tyrosine autokinase [Serratia quinivorans]|uniref:polysaccharide biosynthesis tyrosine autokinase n=1 Tax=Serratia quinivorans TaxID=137545 RepID=UPI001C465614|nr:polysaccharide biosynthesis tyrosine autokinase [Serratia quinivorans]MBV6693117.1 polysaccharide biosynthesis tyrosine autokinase [Serratia quinivorans]
MKRNVPPIIMGKLNEKMDWEKLIYPIWDKRWNIVLVTILFTCLGAGYALSVTPVYQATALLQVEQTSSASAFLQETQDSSIGQSSSIQDEVTLVNSRSILGKTIDSLGLTVHVEPYELPVIGKIMRKIRGNAPPYVKISELSVPASMLGNKLILAIQKEKKATLEQNDALILSGDINKKLWHGDWGIKLTDLNANPGDKFIVTKVSQQKAVNDLQGSLNVTPIGNESSLIKLTLENKDQELARLMLKEIIRNYVENNFIRKATQTQKLLDFVDSQLQENKKSLIYAEDRLDDFRERNISADLPLEIKSTLDAIMKLDEQLNSLSLEELGISKSYTKSHPVYRSLIEKRDILLEEKTRILKKIISLPKMQKDFLALTRDVQLEQQVYIKLKNKQQELRISKAGIVSDIVIVDSTDVSATPVKPKKMLIVIMSFLTGWVISTSLVLLRANLKNGIDGADSLSIFDINVYVTVPLSSYKFKLNKFKQKKMVQGKIAPPLILSQTQPADSAVEAIRSLRTSLVFTMLKARNNILMISGASPMSGKSFISINLATLCANSGQRVLLIDADMRKGTLHHLLSCNPHQGLSDILSGGSTPEKVLIKTSISNLDFVSRGPLPSNPSELLMNRNITHILYWAEKNYDLVVIDTPSVLKVTDAALIGHYAGTSLMVVRFSSDTIKKVNTSLLRLKLNGVTANGLILNGVQGYGSDVDSFHKSHRRIIDFPTREMTP